MRCQLAWMSDVAREADRWRDGEAEEDEDEDDGDERKREREREREAEREKLRQRFPKGSLEQSMTNTNPDCHYASPAAGEAGKKARKQASMKG